MREAEDQTIAVKIDLKQTDVTGWRNHQVVEYDGLIFQGINFNVVNVGNAVDQLDQFFLSGRYTYQQTMDILSCGSLALFSERLQIDDLVSLLELFYDDEAFKKFDEELTKLAEEEIYNETVNISEHSGVPVEECRRILAATR